MIAEEFIVMYLMEFNGISEDVEGDGGSIEGVYPSDDMGIPVEFGEGAEFGVVCWEECGWDEQVWGGLDEEASEGGEEDDVVVVWQVLEIE